MATIEYPSDLIAAQQAATAAWDAVEAYRKGVDARRAEDTPDIPGRPAWIARPRRDWTPDEQAEYDRLHAAAVTAAEARREALLGSGLGEGIEVVQGLHAAARGE